MNASQIANRDNPETASTTQTVSQSKPKKRLNLELTDEAYELLQQVADESGKSMADVLRTGLALYGIAQEENKQGRTLASAEGDKVIKQIVIV